MPTLPTRQLGKDGRQVTAMGAGLMSLGHAYGDAGTDEERIAYLDALYAAGEFNWDNADVYGDSEDVTGKWFAKNPEKRKDIFLTTKFGYVDAMNPTELRTDPEYVKQALEKSLKRLQTTYIDLYYMHRTDRRTPIEKTVEAMVELKKAGKIKYLGLSEVSSTTLRRAYAVHPISAVQLEYSPFALEIESSQTGLLKTCKELGVAVVAYSPLGRGMLTGTIRSRSDIPEGDWRLFLPKYSEENFPKNLALIDQIKSIANKKGVTASQLVLAWLMTQWDMVIPIPGTRNADRALENLGALKVELSAEEDKEIRKIADAAEMAGERYPDTMLDQLFADTPEL